MPGIGAIAATVAVVAATLTFARVGDLHGGTVRLFAAASDATGIIPGSEVWFAGQRVGLVRAVGFRPPSTDTTARILLTLDVLRDQAHLVRRDAVASIGRGGSLIGSPVVHLGTGSPSARAVVDGDTLRARIAVDLGTARLELARVGGELPAILANVRVLGTQLRAAQGTLGALGIEGSRQLDASRRAATLLMTRARQGQGIVGRTLTEREPIRRAAAVSANLREVETLLASTRTSIGRLRADTALPRAAAALRADLAAIQAALDEPRGTVGRLQHDERLRTEVARARADVDALVADLQRNPGRYLRP